VNTPILTAGSKAYFDSFLNGLIPCKVLAVRESKIELSHSDVPLIRVQFKLTAARGPYKRGEVLDASNNFVVPRGAVYLRSGQYRIGFYRTEVSQYANAV
jgi:hypothetical protein